MAGQWRSCTRVGANALRLRAVHTQPSPSLPYPLPPSFPFPSLPQVHYVLFAAEMDDYETFSHRLSTWNRGIGDGGFNKPKTFAPDPNLP